MAPLIKSATILGLAVTAALFVVATGAFAVRLLPWLFAPDVPLSVTAPFARALAARALESALVLGLPVGFAVAVARFAERGEARALQALGVSPAGMVARLALPLVAVATSYLAWASGREESPGRFAAELLSEGRQSCEAAEAPRAVEIPLVGVTWLCFPGSEPIATGRVPGMAERGWFTARSLTPSDDLRQMVLGDLRLSVSGRPLEVKLHTATANIQGLPAWGRPATLRPFPRSALAGGGAAVLALASAYAVLFAGITSRLLSASIGALAGILMVAGVSMIDRSVAGADGPFWYVLAPLAGVVSCLFFGALGAFIRRRGRANWAFVGPSLLGPQGDDKERAPS